MRRHFETPPPHALGAIMADSISLLEALPAAIYTTDAEGRITFLQRGRRRAVGLPARARQERVVRLLEALLAGRHAAAA